MYFINLDFQVDYFLSLLSIILGMILDNLNILQLNIFASKPEMPFFFFLLYPDFI